MCPLPSQVFTRPQKRQPAEQSGVGQKHHALGLGLEKPSDLAVPGPGEQAGGGEPMVKEKMWPQPTRWGMGDGEHPQAQTTLLKGRSETEKAGCESPLLAHGWGPGGAARWPKIDRALTVTLLV